MMCGCVKRVEKCNTICWGERENEDDGGGGEFVLCLPIFVFA